MKPATPRDWPCVKCGSTRRSKAGDCSDCQKVREKARYEANIERERTNARARYAKNREHRKAVSVAYAKANKERRKTNQAEWYKKNRERENARNAAWRKANPERHRDTAVQYYWKNKERRKAYAAAYNKANPDKANSSAMRRYVRKLGAPGDHTTDQWLSLLTSYHGKCVYCGAKATARDHITPLADGGSNDIENIVPACKSCNSSKRTRPLLVWMLIKHKRNEKAKGKKNAIQP